MTRLTHGVAAVTLAVCVAAGVHLSAQVEEVLVDMDTSGAMGNATVPDGVCYIRIRAAGGEGGMGRGGDAGAPGLGALIEARVPVTPGASLAYSVGGAGADATVFGAGAGGEGGGGHGGGDPDGHVGGGGGGGASVVALDSPAPALLVLAGGGGGAGAGSLDSGGGQAGEANGVGGQGQGDAVPASGGTAAGVGGNGGTHSDGLVDFGGGGGGGVSQGGLGGGDQGGGGGTGDGMFGGGGGGGGLEGDPGDNGGDAMGAGGAGGSAESLYSGAGGTGLLGVGGGGGGAGQRSGGGGAGYGGGGGAAHFAGGGGGSSFVTAGAEDADIESGTNGGDGFVIITYDEVADACTRPAFAQAFAPAAIRDGETSTLTFTIDGSATTVGAMNVAFTNTLPAGLAIAPTPNASSTCGGTLTATAGTNTIALTGGTLDDGTSCTVSVDVTASSMGSLVSTSGDLTSTLGNSGTSTATLIVTAAPVTSESVNAATGTGTIDVAISGGSGCSLTSASAITAEDAAGAPPDGVELLHGLVDLSIEGCSPGATVTLAVTYPETLPADATFWKYGPTTDDPSPHWYEITPSSISGATVTYTITDGGLGDDDLAVNGTIEDPAGPGITATAVPTMPAMWFIALAMLLIGAGAMAARRSFVLG